MAAKYYLTEEAIEEEKEWLLLLLKLQSQLLI